MNEFVLIRMTIPPPRHLGEQAGPREGDILESPKNLKECVLVSGAIGKNLWQNLERFLKKNQVECKAICRAVYHVNKEDPNFGLYFADYVLQIPNNAHAMFFKLHFGEELAKALETV